MYNARFVNDRGREFVFGLSAGTVFDIEPLTGATATLGTSQGYSQTGDTVTGKSIGGITRNISGVIVGANKAQIKQQMLSAFAPTASGRLYFNDLYYAECEVKKIPEFQKSGVKEVFDIQVYCAYPYWFAAEETVYSMNTFDPAFTFPVNYAQPHRFGVKSLSQFVNVINYGEEPSPMTMEFFTTTETTNYRLTNVNTLEYIAITDTLHIGDKVTVSRKNGTLTVSKVQADGTVADIFEALDEASTLFDAQPGDNVFVLAAESGIEGLMAMVRLATAKVGVYDGIE